ncbi:MAG: TBPIP family protein [Asgard group archaeon]|nr:TBPIP family protein [Asgard group archaeon]
MPPIKKNQLTPEDAKLLVQQYMKDQYRPYSTTDIQLNMHNILTKAKLTNVLESLVSDNELIFKTIGKTNYYTYKQLNVDDSSGDNPKEDYDLLQKLVKELNQEIGELKISMYY